MITLRSDHDSHRPLCITVGSRLAGFEPATNGLEGHCSSAELQAQSEQDENSNMYCQRIGAAGFEPTTTCTQNRCATRLRHTPMLEPQIGFEQCCTLTGSLRSVKRNEYFFLVAGHLTLVMRDLDGCKCLYLHLLMTRTTGRCSARK